jgi:tetratricopeptide (TPR) repeat protein
MTEAQTNQQTASPSIGSSPVLVVGVALILSAMWMLVWRGSLDGVFHFDDYSNIVDNQRIRRLWPLNEFLSNNRPIGLYSFAINYHFSGTEPFSYHVVNLTIHVVNGLLLFTGSYLTARLWRLNAQQSDLRPESSPSPPAQRRWSTGLRTTLNHSEPDNAVVQTPDFTGGNPAAEFSHWPLLIASLISTIWVIHPLTTQAVTNVVQRYESLVSLGYLGAWVGLLVYLCGSRWLGNAMILSAAWIGLMSKEVFATAPLVILMFDRLMTQQSWLTLLRLRWLPYLLMVTPFLWFVPSVARFFDPVRTQNDSMGIGIESINSWQYLRTQPEVIWHYLQLVVWPRDLCFDYLWRIQDDPKIYLSLGASIVALFLLALGCYFRGLASAERHERPSGSSESEKAAENSGSIESANETLVVPASAGMSDLPTFEDSLKTERPTISKPGRLRAAHNSAAANTKWLGMAGWLGLTFFVILAPTSSVMPIADLAVEHRMYLASAVVIAGVVLTLGHVAAILIQNSQRPVVLQAAFTCILVAGISLLGWRTHLRNRDYRDGLVLWTTAARISPENPRVWYNVGRELYNRGGKQAALPAMVSAVGFSEKRVAIFDMGLADCLRHVGRTEDAITLYRRAISNKRHFPEAYNNLGAVYLEQNRLEEAEQAFQMAMEQNHMEAKYNLSIVYLRQKRFPDAIRLLESTLHDQPTLRVAARRLAWILATAPDPQLRDVHRAEQMMLQQYHNKDDGNIYVLDTWAAIQAAKGDFEAAIRLSRQAIALARSRSGESIITELHERVASYERRQPWTEGTR